MGRTVRKREMPLWEPKWDEEALRRERAGRTHQSFERGFRQRPFSEEDRLFRLSDIAEATRLGLGVGDMKDRRDPCYTGVDLSSTKRPGVAFFTMMVTSAEGKSVRVPVDIKKGVFRGGSLVKQFERIEKDWHPQVYLIENNSLQERIIDMLSGMEETKDLPIGGYHTGKQKSDPDTGLPSLALEFERGLWAIPWRGMGRKEMPPDGHGTNCVCGWCSWYHEEMALYPMCETYDTLMAMWFAREAYRLYGAMAEDFEVIEGPAVRGTFRI